LRTHGVPGKTPGKIYVDKFQPYIILKLGNHSLPHCVLLDVFDLEGKPWKA